MKRSPLALALLLTACASAPSSPSDPKHPPLPLPLGAADAAGFAVAELPSWSLIGNELTPGHDTLEIEVTSKEEIEVVHVWIADEAIELERQGERNGETFRALLDVSQLEAGEHTLLFAADASRQAFAQRTFTRTHPLYVLTTTDWDDPDNPDENLERHAELHRRHPELKITHLVAPYTFTDLTLSEERVLELVEWCKAMRDTHGDEIGVHIHPYRHLVEAAGAEFHAEPTGTGRPDPTGYTVHLSVYEEDELVSMLELTTTLFEENGLGRPVSFRAGAWNADARVMRALATAGYRVDTSALNTSRLEEWRGAPLYDWVTTHWPDIDDRSQPYYMNRDDAASAEPPHLPVLQVPDNGALVDYVSGAEMIEILRANWLGGALTEPRAVSIGWHPPNFEEEYFERIDEALTEYDRHLASEGNGPLVYARLGDMTLVWPSSRAESGGK